MIVRMESKQNIAIIGAGACGLVSAIEVAKSDASIVIYEKDHKAGRKIAASGNGHCNISNRVISMKNYHGYSPHFAKDIIKFDAKRYFEELGLELREKAHGRLYPYNDQAQIVVDILLYHAQKSGVEIRYDTAVDSIEKSENGFIINGTDYFDRVILATGSSAMPRISGSESGYALAQSLGHTIVTPLPSLVQLITEEEDFFGASGVKVNVELKLLIEGGEKMHQTGDLLFTNYGLSGSAILDLSRSASLGLWQRKQVKIVADLFKEMEIDRLKNLLQRRAKLSLPIELWLGGILPKKLITPLLKRAKVDRKTAQNRRSIHVLAYAMKHLEFTIKDTKGAKKAEVMAGGVSTNEIDPKSLESKLHKGLYFCGEMIDIDGDCGGYNLHWAWSSGYCAGRSAVSDK